MRLPPPAERLYGKQRYTATAPYNYGDNGGVVHVTTATGRYSPLVTALRAPINEYGTLHTFIGHRRNGRPSSSFAQCCGAFNGLQGCLNVGAATGGKSPKFGIRCLQLWNFKLRGDCQCPNVGRRRGGRCNGREQLRRLHQHGYR
jgi:hypothetical protein